MEREVKSQFPAGQIRHNLVTARKHCYIYSKGTVLFSGYDSELGTANLVTRFDMMLLVLPHEELVLIFCIGV